jgi:hypothetical protein
MHMDRSCHTTPCSMQCSATSSLLEARVTLLEDLSTLEVALLDRLSIYLAHVDYFDSPRLVGGG